MFDLFLLCSFAVVEYYIYSMEFSIRKVLNESNFPHGPIPHAFGHLWGEGQKYVPKNACFLVHSLIFPIVSVMEPVFSQIWNAFLTYVLIYIKHKFIKLLPDT